MNTLVNLLRDRNGRLLLVLPVVIVLAVVVSVVWDPLGRLRIPSTATSEHDLEQAAGARAGERVAASCQRPTKAGWTCLLRAADGRYGYASGELSGTRHRVGTGRYTYSYTTTNVRYDWGFYVAADGAVDYTADVTGADDTTDDADLVDVIAFGAAENAARSVGAQPPDETGFACPALAVGATVTCQVSGGAPMRIQRTGPGAYHIRTTQPLPGASGYHRDPSLPAPPHE